MNERIKQLALQAKEETDALYAKLTPQEFKDTYNQKFAELIVKECADRCEMSPYPHPNYSVAIKKHFGVEA
jgi:hypothetical protein